MVLKTQCLLCVVRFRCELYLIFILYLLCLHTHTDANTQVLNRHSLSI